MISLLRPNSAIFFLGINTDIRKPNSDKDPIIINIGTKIFDNNGMLIPNKLSNDIVVPIPTIITKGIMKKVATNRLVILAPSPDSTYDRISYSTDFFINCLTWLYVSLNI